MLAVNILAFSLLGYVVSGVNVLAFLFYACMVSGGAFSLALQSGGEALHRAELSRTNERQRFDLRSIDLLRFRV